MNKFNFSDVISRFDRVKNELPKELANEMQREYNSTFVSQSWNGSGWKTPNRKIEGTSEWKYPKKKGLGRRTSNTLVRTGALRRAVSTALKLATFEKIKFEVSLPYAQIHNEGLPMKNGKNMPKRQFIGMNSGLKNKIDKKIDKVISTIWQG